MSRRGTSRLKWLRWLVLCFTALALVRLDLVLWREIIRVSDAQRRHELLLLCRTRLASRGRRIDDWRSFWSHRCRLVKFLTQEIGLVSKKNVGSFNLSKVETKCSYFIRRDCQGVDVWANVIPEGLSGLYDTCESFFFLGLERKILQLILPSNELFKLRTSSISRNLQTPITDRASVLVVFLDLTASDLETFSMVPRCTLTMQALLEEDSRLTIRDIIHTRSSCQLQVCDRDRRHQGSCSWCRAPEYVPVKKARPASSAYHEARNKRHFSL
jgi:hypothetical protein